jgi:hypothetical protein
MPKRMTGNWNAAIIGLWLAALRTGWLRWLLRFDQHRSPEPVEGRFSVFALCIEAPFDRLRAAVKFQTVATELLFPLLSRDPILHHLIQHV